MSEAAPAVRYTLTICFVGVLLVQAPWVSYFIGKIIQSKRKYRALVKNQNQDDTVRKLKIKHMNQLILHKYLLTTISLEVFAVSLSIFLLILSANKYTIQFNCSEYWFVVYIYVKYGASLFSVLVLESALELVNLTTIFVKDFYLYDNTYDGMKKKKKWFLLRFIIIAGLAASGVGIGFGLILVQIFYIAQTVQYYKLSIQLYRSLKLRYEDVQYEFGSSSSEAAAELNYIKHYRRAAIWCFIIGLNAIAFTLAFLFTIPQTILGEVCIYELIASQGYTWINSTAYQLTETVTLGLDAIFYGIFVILYLPVFVLYTLYYLCDKLLFVRVYKHRYQVRYSMIEQDMGRFFV